MFKYNAMEIVYIINYK